MSTNLHIVGTRQITVNKTGKCEQQRIHFDCWQTPTNVTREIMESHDHLKAYQEWVRSRSADRVEPVFDSDDYFCERPPIGTRIVNDGEDHIEELQEWITLNELLGYEITTEAW